MASLITEGFSGGLAKRMRSRYQDREAGQQRKVLVIVPCCLQDQSMEFTIGTATICEGAERSFLEVIF